MSEINPSALCLLGLFHVRSRYNPEVQHVFAVATRRHENGLRQVITVNATRGEIRTSGETEDHCNSAILYPLTPKCFEALRDHFEAAHALGGETTSSIPFYYFSKDMSPDPECEIQGRRAVDPFGRIEARDPVRQNTYQKSPDEITLARVNCVVMSLYAASIAGIDDPAFSSVRRAAAFEKTLKRLTGRGVRAEKNIRTADGTPFVLRRHDGAEGRGDHLTLFVPGRDRRIEAAACLDACEAMLRRDEIKTGLFKAPNPS